MPETIQFSDLPLGKYIPYHKSTVFGLWYEAPERFKIDVSLQQKQEIFRGVFRNI